MATVTVCEKSNKKRLLGVIIRLLFVFIRRLLKLRLKFGIIGLEVYRSLSLKFLNGKNPC